MLSSHRMLFPVDFSSDLFAVPPAIAEFIDRPNVEVILLHVIETGTLPVIQLARRMEMLDVLARRHFSHCAVRKRLDYGSPAPRVLDYIRENEIEMTIMPARDAETFGKGPLGRVAGEILREACCPVWLEWRTAEQQRVSRATASCICCAVDSTRSDEQIARVIRDAAVVADQLGSELTIVSAIAQRPNSPPALFQDSPMSEAEVLRETERIDRLRRRIARKADVLVAAGWCQMVIGRAVRKHRARLLITDGCMQAVLAAEPTCPVLRLPRHFGGTVGLHTDLLTNYRRVA